MKKFTVIVEIKNGTREEITLEANDRDQLQRILVDSFAGELVNTEILTEVEVYD